MTTTLTDILSSLQNQMTKSGQADAYTTFYNYISSSPALMQNLSNDAGTAITGMTYVTSAQNGADQGGGFSPGTNGSAGPIEIGSLLLNRLISEPGITAEYDVISFIAHEDEHAENAVNMANADVQYGSQLSSFLSNPSAQRMA